MTSDEPAGSASRLPQPQASEPQASEPSEADASDVGGRAPLPEPRLPDIAPSAVHAATGGVHMADTASPGPCQLEVEVDVPDSATADQDAASVDHVAEVEEIDEDVAEWRAIPLSTRLEALLFAATEPLTLRRLQSLVDGSDTADLRDALASLAAYYDTSGRAFALEEIGGGFQLRTRSELSELIGRLGRRTASEKLSPAAVETLAIVAYRQPVLRVDVEKIRGVASGEVLRTLIEKGVIRVAGRADLPGSPLLYGTTPAFLELFGLRDLKDLPKDRRA